jgi:multisubunit Na+/H+ antiporter MnhC subunit
MADKTEVVNAGEQITTAPSALPLKTDEQFRLINQRLDKLVGEFEKIAKPPQFRLADVVGLIAIVIGFAVGAFGLSERIADVSKHQGDAETRLDGSINAMEQRLGTRLDKLGDQFSSMDERTARLEGEKAIKSEKPR